MAVKPKTHLVIPDCQVRPDVDYSHLKWIGNYIADKRPDRIIQIGDFGDLPSLSSYAVGKASAEGKRYADDIAASKEAMSYLCGPWKKLHGYRPGQDLTLGNHEDRIDREADTNPRWKGFLSSNDLGYREFGWKVHPFLKVARIDDIEYVHYVTSGVMGRPVTSAAAMLRERHSSVVQGHVQKLDIAVHDKTQHFALMSGICYQHDEGYLGHQGNNTKRGIWVLNEVRDGTADLMFVSLGFLRRKYS